MLEFRRRNSKAHVDEHATWNLIGALIIFAAAVLLLGYVWANKHLPPLPDLSKISISLPFTLTCDTQDARAVWQEAGTVIAQDDYGHTYSQNGSNWRRTGRTAQFSAQKTVTVQNITYSVLESGEISAGTTRGKLCK